MEVIRGLENIRFSSGRSFVTIGIFDGVHKGHQKIIRTLKKMTGRRGRAVLLTFNPHPVRFLNPKGRFYEISTVEERVDLIRPFSIDHLIIADFNDSLSAMKPDTFIDEVLIGRFRASGVVVGYDFVFGSKREGDTKFLRKKCMERGIKVEIVDPITFMGSIVSSTRIRELVLSGRVREASLFLGRHYVLSGPVVHGSGRGKTLGFPTANIAFLQGLLPLPGVYAVRVLLRDNLYRGVCSVGFNPTFGEKSLRVEVNIFEFNCDIYGEDVSLYLIDRIRDERKYKDVSGLVDQIKHDIQAAEKILRERDGS